MQDMGCHTARNVELCCVRGLVVCTVATLSCHQLHLDQSKSCRYTVTVQAAVTVAYNLGKKSLLCHAGAQHCNVTQLADFDITAFLASVFLLTCPGAGRSSTLDS